MRATATPTSPHVVLPLRIRYRQEMNCQIVHDSIHRRPGWTATYALHIDDTVAGFASVAIGGPWTGVPTLFEFYVLPAYRRRAFHLFEVVLSASGVRFMAVQSNDVLLAVMLHTYGRDIRSEAIVFHDRFTTALPANGATLQQVTSDEDTRVAIAERHGGTEWRLQVEGESVATGGILFHYNAPYSDVYIEVAEPFRRRGLGSYLLQELKRVAYELGTAPCTRCSPDNVPSRQALQRAGFVPFAHILKGSIVEHSVRGVAETEPPKRDQRPNAWRG
jgi:GNAT superfamily N-acetyltransferase